MEGLPDHEWDDAKRQSNISKHGVDFLLMAEFDWDSAIVVLDHEHDEPRWIAKGCIGAVLHVAVFTERGHRIRMISLHKATRQEMRDYAEI